MKIEEFNHPTMHVIDANKHVVLWTEVYGSSAWLWDGATLARGGQSYKVVRHQPGVHHYYVWAERIESA